MAKRSGGRGSNQYQRRGRSVSATRSDVAPISESFDADAENAAWMFHPDSAPWRDLGLEWQHAHQWMEAGFTADRADDWMSHGFTAEGAAPWGPDWDPIVATDWLANGFKLSDAPHANAWHDADVDPEVWAQMWSDFPIDGHEWAAGELDGWALQIQGLDRRHRRRVEAARAWRDEGLDAETMRRVVLCRASGGLGLVAGDPQTVALIQRALNEGASIDDACRAAGLGADS